MFFWILRKNRGRLLASKDIRYRDRFLVASFFTRIQSLFCLGVRKPTNRNKALSGFYSFGPFPIVRIFSAGHLSYKRSWDYGFSQNKGRDMWLSPCSIEHRHHQPRCASERRNWGGIYASGQNIRDSNDDQGRLMCFLWGDRPADCWKMGGCRTKFN